MPIPAAIPTPEAVFPQWMSDTQFLQVNLAEWAGLGVLTVLALMIGSVGQWLLLHLGTMLSGKTGIQWDDRFMDLLPGPLRLFIGLLVLALASPLLGLHEEASAGFTLVMRTLLIIAVVWLLMRLIRFGAGLLETYLLRGVTDANRKRSVHTQIAVPRAILRVIAIVLGVALILLQFEVVRSVGVSMLASAGVATLVLGLAAQKSAANLLAGIQLAIFQPIRIGDVVVVEGEWGTIEEMGLSNVMVQIWDQRRLILPVTYFLEKPFENWTRGSSELLGTVYLHVDYTVPFEDIRKEMNRVLKASDLWDKRASGLIVSNLNEQTVELRAMVSAKDSSDIWNLRCHLREKLLTWLQNKGYDYLPLTRISMDQEVESEG